MRAQGVFHAHTKLTLHLVSALCSVIRAKEVGFSSSWLYLSSDDVIQDVKSMCNRWEWGDQFEVNASAKSHYDCNDGGSDVAVMSKLVCILI